MESIRKTIKAYLITVVLFFILTLILAAVITYTGVEEDWSYVGLIFLLTVTTVLLGYLEGRIIGRRGLIVGFVSSLVFLVIIIITVKAAFSASIVSSDLQIFLIVPLIAGAIGGVVGANSNN